MTYAYDALELNARAYLDCFDKMEGDLMPTFPFIKIKRH